MTDSSSAFSSLFCLECKQQFLLCVKKNSAHKTEEPISDKQVNIDISTVITEFKYFRTWTLALVVQGGESVASLTEVPFESAQNR